MRPPSSISLVFLFVSLAVAGLNSFGALPQAIDTALVLTVGGRSRGAEFFADPVAAQIVGGQWKTPREGDSVPVSSGQSSKWRRVAADTNGLFSGPGLSGGYLFAICHSDHGQPALLEAAGHSMVYVNGAPRAGDIYSSGITLLPVLLKAGENEFLFQTGRGQLRARLLPARSRALFNPHDMTLPDFHPENPANNLGAVIVLNASAETLHGIELRVTDPAGRAASLTVPATPWFM